MNNLFNYQRLLLLNFQKLLNAVNPLALIDRTIMREHSQPPQYPPIFIVGAPRTGSTLLLQLLINQYRFAYLTNLQSLFFKSPLIIARITSLIIKSKSHSFTSTYGYSPGLFAPSEAGKVFNHWLGKSDRNPRLSKNQARTASESVGFLSNNTQAPFLSKNLQNSLRLRKINQVFPKAFYIWIDRDIKYTAQSLLEMRKKLYQDENRWASIKPFTYQKIKKTDPLTQVVLQVESINQYIKNFLKSSKPNFYICVKYQNLCNNPREEIARIAAAYHKQTKIKLTLTNNPLPKIKSQNIKKLPEKRWIQLIKTIKKANTPGVSS